MADILKHKDDQGFAGADPQDDFWTRATSWSVGANVPCSVIKNEADEQARNAQVPVEDNFPAISSGGGARELLGNPHNKRGPKSGPNAPFDAAGADDLQASYKQDPPIAQDNLSNQVAGDGGPQVLSTVTGR